MKDVYTTKQGANQEMKQTKRNQTTEILCPKKARAFHMKWMKFTENDIHTCPKNY